MKYKRLFILLSILLFSGCVLIAVESGVLVCAATDCIVMHQKP